MKKLILSMIVVSCLISGLDAQQGPQPQPPVSHQAPNLNWQEAVETVKNWWRELWQYVNQGETSARRAVEEAKALKDRILPQPVTSQTPVTKLPETSTATQTAAAATQGYTPK